MDPSGVAFPGTDQMKSLNEHQSIRREKGTFKLSSCGARKSLWPLEMLKIVQFTKDKN
jgi:hypothetical protein